MTKDNTKMRGRTFVGVVISTKMSKTAVVEWKRITYIPKYERYENKRTKVKAHIPDSIEVKDGDIVKITECRPLSKTKNFIVTEVLGQEEMFKERMESLEEAKVQDKEEKPEEVKQAEVSETQDVSDDAQKSPISDKSKEEVAVEEVKEEEKDESS